MDFWIQGDVNASSMVSFRCIFDMLVQSKQFAGATFPSRMVKGGIDTDSPANLVAIIQLRMYLLTVNTV